MKPLDRATRITVPKSNFAAPSPNRRGDLDAVDAQVTMGLLRTIFLRSNSGRRDAAVHFCSALRTATAATPSFGDYTAPPPGFRELPAEPEKSWSYTEFTPVLIYAFAAMALFLTVFLRGSHQVFCLGLVNGAVFAACCCLRDAPRKKTYHLSQP